MGRTTPRHLPIVSCRPAARPSPSLSWRRGRTSRSPVRFAPSWCRTPPSRGAPAVLPGAGLPSRPSLRPAPISTKPGGGHLMGTLSDRELDGLLAYWEAANYLTVAQIYLLDNPLLREPLTPDHIK